MVAPFRQSVAVAGLAVTELLRQPVCFLLTLSSVVATIFLPMATALQLGQQTHLARDSAFAFEFVFGLMLAGYAACTTLHRECLSGTVLTVLSKPVGRSSFFVAKFAALVVVLLLFIGTSTVAALLGERLTPLFFEFDLFGLRIVLLALLLACLPAAAMNYFRGRSFVAHAQILLPLALSVAVVAIGSVDREGHRIAFGSLMDWRLVPACVLEGLALILLAAVALSLATRMGLAPTVAILVILLSGGLISDYLVNALPATPALRFGLRACLPDLQSFWPADALSGTGTVTWTAFAQAATYATFYTTGVLCLGLAAFRNRQF